MNDRINSGLPVDTNTQPISVKEEDLPKLDAVRDTVEQLNQYRMELGRLYQILNNLRRRADQSEDELRQKREELLGSYGLSAGSWAIDFGKNVFVKLEENSPAVV